MPGQYRDRQFETLRSLLFKSITNIASDLHTDGPVYGQAWLDVAEPGPTLNWRSRLPLIGPRQKWTRAGPSTLRSVNGRYHVPKGRPFGRRHRRYSNENEQRP